MFHARDRFVVLSALACGWMGSAALGQCPGSWTLIPEGDVGVRYDGAMVFDSARHQLIDFGGYDGVTFRNTTLVFDTLAPVAGWSDVTPGGSPGGRLYHNMVYDVVRDRVVMFGGYDYDAGDWSDETWEYDPGANSWSLVNTTTGPSARGLFAMAYDSIRGVTVLHGGLIELPGQNVTFADTWEYDGTNWTLVASGGPISRGFNAMAFDSARGECVMFGGWHHEPTTNYFLRDTWTWNGAGWTQRHPAGTIPEATSWHMMVFDSVRQVVVMATSYNQNLPHHTYEWDGTQWKSVAVGGLVPDRYASQMAFDSHRGIMVLLGGYYYDGMDHFFGDMWEWTGGNPAEPVNFTAQPQDDFVCHGGVGHFSVGVTGQGPFTYQWRHNGMNFGPPGPTPAIMIPGASDLLAGLWSCAVTNGCGTELSVEARLTVGLAADLNDDNVVNTGDLVLFLAKFGQMLPPGSPEDVNGDGVVNTQDLVLFLALFGRTCP